MKMKERFPTLVAMALTTVATVGCGPGNTGKESERQNARQDNLTQGIDRNLAELAKKQQDLREIEKRNQVDLERIKGLENALRKREDAIGERERAVERTTIQLAETEQKNRQALQTISISRNESQDAVVASWERFISSAKTRIAELDPDYKTYNDDYVKLLYGASGRMSGCTISFKKDDLKPSDSLKSKFIGTATVYYRATYVGATDKQVPTVMLPEWDVTYNFGLRNGSWFFMGGVARLTTKNIVGGQTTKVVADEIEFSDLVYDKAVKGHYQRWGRGFVRQMTKRNAGKGSKLEDLSSKGYAFHYAALYRAGHFFMPSLTTAAFGSKRTHRTELSRPRRPR